MIGYSGAVAYSLQDSCADLGQVKRMKLDPLNGSRGLEDRIFELAL